MTTCSETSSTWASAFAKVTRTRNSAACLLIRKDYDVLVLAHEHRGCLFGERPIEEFAARMPCPIVLVGPGQKDAVYLNTPASLWAETLGLNKGEWLLVG